ncbi:phage major capsid protein, P2 family [Methyloversatilis sp.]|uniref:phage major capsid protein, P2 family n=1 Tax=Methyloversatilis sp. TaxID=2569862 RepID=UPI002732B59C|nr:phage major capsid protein, P2 family [Methyloversatilis sp.]MDP3579154.1 phage major capsid protein, P2 family [Methyloversatilis sp.]
MRTQTRQAFNAYLQQMAQINGVTSALEKFAVDPSVQQRLEQRMQETSSFLGRINMMGVTEQQGAKLGLGIGGPIASRTNTTTTDRGTTDPTALDDDVYFCKQTNFDTHLTYAKMDAWAKFPNFQTMIRDVILQRQALDRIMVGFNGVSAAAATDPVANPLRQDVNIGWLQQYRANKPASVMTGGGTAGQIRIGSAAGADYATLDALVFDLVNNLIEPWYREDPGLVAVVGRSMMADKYFPLINSTQPATEQIATDLVISQKRIGGLPGVQVPFMIDDGVMVTTLDNLSLYWQEGGRRRTIVDNAKRDRIETYDSSNDAYVVEDYGRGCMAENITFSWS